MLGLLKAAKTSAQPNTVINGGGELKTAVKVAAEQPSLNSIETSLALPASPLSSDSLHLVSPPRYRAVSYFPGVLSAPAALALVQAIDASGGPWVELRGRRLQQWGGQPLPASAGGGVDGFSPLPPFLASIAASLSAAGIFPSATPPNHVLVNDYALGEGILAHTDGPRYHPCVATLSLGDSSVMRFSVLFGREREGEQGGQVLGELLLEGCSLVVTREECYTQYAHSIAEESESVLGSVWNAALLSSRVAPGDRFQREGRRVSVTFRHVL
jgi:alkylated DNA repair protein alkB family protein 6